MEKLKKYLALSQASLFGLLFICCLIIPSIVIKNGGVSNFGNHLSTLIPYVLSFLLAIAFIFMAANTIQRKSVKLNRLALILYILGLLYFLVLISTFPRRFDFIYSDIHDYLGIALFAYEFFISIWFLLKEKSQSTIIFFIVEVIGSMIGFLSILKYIHFLFIGQFIGTVGFGFLLIITFPKIIESLYPLSKRNR